MGGLSSAHLPPLIRPYLARVQFSILDEEEEDVGMFGNVFQGLHFRRCA